MSGEVTMDGGGGTEDHIAAQVVLPVAAEVAVAARYSRFNGYAIPNFQARYTGAQLKVIQNLMLKKSMLRYPQHSSLLCRSSTKSSQEFNAKKKNNFMVSPTFKHVTLEPNSKESRKRR